MKPDEITTRNVLDVFFRMETAEDLFLHKLSDATPFWDVLRRDVYLTLHTLHGGPFALPQRLPPPSLAGRAKDLLKPMANWLSRRYLVRKAPNYLFFTLQRTRRGDDLVDVLSDHLVQLVSTEAAAVELANDSAINHWRLVTGGETRVPPLRIATPRFDAEVQEIARFVERLVLKHFGTAFDFRRLVSDAIWCHRETRKYYEKLFKVVRPKAVVAINIANLSGMLEVAKKLGIPTVELQHGGSSSHTIIWSYPRSISPSHPGLLAPTAYFTFAEFWNVNTNYPVELFRSIGNDFMFQDTVCANGQGLLFVSSYLYRESLLKIAIELSDLHENRKIFFKLHPHEYSAKASVLEAVGGRSNLVVVMDEVDFTELFTFCEYVVGVQSTMLYVALQARKKVCILKIANYFWHSDIFDHVALFDTPAELLLITSSITGNYFQNLDSVPVIFKPFDDQNFLRALQDVEQAGRHRSSTGASNAPREGRCAKALESRAEQ